MRGHGLQVELLKYHFPGDAPDAEWLPKVGEWGWIILTKDDQIRKREVERNALLRSGARAFILSSGNIPRDQMISMIVNALPKIERFVSKNQPPFIARITKASDVRKIE